MPDKVKRVMKEFTIEEISAVDEPAQEGAKAVIMKAASDQKGYKEDDKAKKSFSVGDMVQWSSSGGTARGKIERIVRDGKIDVPDSDFTVNGSEDNPAVLIRLVDDEGKPRDQRVGHRMNTLRSAKMDGKAEKMHHRTKTGLLLGSTNGHQHGIDVTSVMMPGNATVTSYDAGEDDEHGHAHPVVVNPDGSIEVGEAKGHTHTVDAEKLVAMREIVMRAKMAQQTLAMERGDMVGKATETLTAKKDGQNMSDELATLKADLAVQTAIAGMDDATKAYFNGLDDEAKAEFIVFGTEKRAEVVAKAAAAASEADPVIYKSIDGREFRKSDDERLVAEAKRGDAMAKQLAAQNDTLEKAALEKRATKELANLGGELDTQVALLKAVDGIADEGTRGKVMELLKAKADGLAKAQTTIGAAGDAGSTNVNHSKAAEAELEALAKARVEKEGEDYFTAYDVVKNENPELYKRAVRG